MISFKNKNILITGASGGIGNALVKKFVTLAEIKSNENLADLALIKQARLSVVPVSKEHWKEICKMAKTASYF